MATLSMRFALLPNFTNSDSALTATLLDEHNAAITGATLTYTLTDPDGVTVRSSGSLTAGAQAGTYTAAIAYTALPTVGLYTVVGVAIDSGGKRRTATQQLQVYGSLW